MGLKWLPEPDETYWLAVSPSTHTHMHSETRTHIRRHTQTPYEIDRGGRNKKSNSTITQPGFKTNLGFGSPRGPA